MVAIPPTHPPTTTNHTPTAGPATTKHRRQPTPTGGFTTIDTPPRRVAGVSQPYGRNSPRAPAHTRQQRVWPQPTRPATTANPAPTGGPATTKHSHQPTPTGGFTTIDTPPRRVAGVSHPYGRNSPHTPTHNHQPHTHSRPSHDQTPPPTHANRGFYYHRHPTTACRRRVAALWSQFPPRTHPQPPTLRPSNNTAPRTPRATPIHNLTTAAFADATATRPRQRGVLLP